MSACVRSAKRIAVVVLALTLLAVTSVSAQDRPLVVEDYYSIQTIGSPTISPGGDWVAFTLSSRVEEDNSSPSEVWLTSTSGAVQPRRVSPSGIQATRAVWGEDGRLGWVVGDSVFFVHPDSPDASPEARPTSSLGRQAGPGNQGYAWLEETPPDAVVPEYDSDFERRHAQRFAGQMWDHMYFQRDRQDMPTADPTDPAETPAREVYVAADLGGAGRALTSLGLRPSALTWSPDGDGLVFTADANHRDEQSYGRTDLWYVPTDGSAAFTLTDDARYTASGPAWDPRGGRIAYRRRAATQWVVETHARSNGPTDLILLDLSGPAETNLTADWDLQPGAPLWSPDGSWVYFTAGIGGETHLFRAAADGSGVEQVTEGPRRLRALTIDEHFTRMTYLSGGFDAPPELYTADIDGGNERRLTGVHDALVEDIDFQDAERIVFPSYDGTEIEGWLMLPRGYRADGGPYPLVVHSHGGPHSASGYGFNFKHQLFAANGYMVLQTNFRSSTGYGEEFLWATWGAWGDKDGEDVMSGIDYVQANYPADPTRTGTIGHSYGGFMSNWLITQYPDRFRAAVVGAGISNWLSDYGTADVAVTKETEFFGMPWTEEGRTRLLRQSPLIYADQVQAATLFVHGEVDHRVPFEEGEQMYFALKKNGVPAKFILYADQSHGIRGHWNVVHRMINELDWWERYLRLRERGISQEGS